MIPTLTETSSSTPKAVLYLLVEPGSIFSFLTFFRALKTNAFSPLGEFTTSAEIVQFFFPLEDEVKDEKVWLF